MDWPVGVSPLHMLVVKLVTNVWGSRTLVPGFVVCVWALQLSVSRPWLERFRFGPLEWAWRSATYGRLEPMRRPPAREAARRAPVGPLVVFVWLALAAGCGSDDGRTTDGGGAAADATDGAPPDQDAASQTDPVDGAAADSDASRTPTPPPAREAGSCPDYAQLRQGLVCTDQPLESGCGTDADCAEGLCQPEFSVGSPTCSCAPTACQSDAECGEDEACSCAVALPRATVLPTPTCGTGRDNECASRCLPAACRVDGDCAAGERCAAHYDGCGNRLGFACWGADTAECGTPADCPAMNTTCMFNGEAWRCGPVGGICD